jgi:hypothetical protein
VPVGWDVPLPGLCIDACLGCRLVHTGGGFAILWIETGDEYLRRAYDSQPTVPLVKPPTLLS